MTQRSALPYFDEILQRLDRGDPALARLFGRHVHWGLWGPDWSGDCSISAYEQATDRLSTRHFDLARIGDGHSILDAGCGFGGTAAMLNERFSQVRIWGINIDERQAARASQTITPRATNRLSFDVGDACQLPYDDGAFDAALAIECIFHFPSRERFLEEAHRVLCSGGRLVVSDILLNSRRGLWLALAAPFFSKPIAMTFGDSIKPTDEKTYRSLAKKIGFVEVSCEDVSAEILPTFTFYRTQLAEHRLPRHVHQAIRWLGILYRYRLLRYVLLCFEKA